MFGAHFKELEVLMMHNRTYCVEFVHNVSIRKRKEIAEEASRLDVVTSKLCYVIRPRG